MSTSLRLARPLFLSILLATLLALPLTEVFAKDDQTLAAIPDRPAAPDFVLKDPEGRTQRLTDYRGRPLILHFWATWCPPCREEMPSLQRAYEALKADGIAVVAINVGEDVDTIDQFMEDEPVDFPLPMDTDTKVAQGYPMKGLPASFVIDPQGRLVYSAMGTREWDDPKLLDLVRALK